jgi:hypothetical protein
VSDNNEANRGRVFFERYWVSPDELLERDPSIGIIVLSNYDNMLDIVQGLQQKGFMNVKPFLEVFQYKTI